MDLNDYKVDIPHNDVRRFDVVLARLTDDKPIAVREQGPLFVIYPSTSDPSCATPCTAGAASGSSNRSRGCDARDRRRRALAPCAGGLAGAVGWIRSRQHQMLDLTLRYLEDCPQVSVAEVQIEFLRLRVARRAAAAEFPDAARAIPELPAPAGAVPIVALTADVLSDTCARCAEAVVNDFLTKPVGVAELARLLAGCAADPPSAGQGVPVTTASASIYAA